jgi:predicted RNA binding protein YcfA (HicA-like mRNA interferase family)
VLVDFGFVRARVAGSHQLYKHPALKERLVIPRRRPILPVYIKQALEAIDEVRSKGEPEQ